jgi:hypothetical protein
MHLVQGMTERSPCWRLRLSWGLGGLGLCWGPGRGPWWPDPRRWGCCCASQLLGRHQPLCCHGLLLCGGFWLCGGGGGQQQLWLVAGCLQLILLLCWKDGICTWEGHGGGVLGRAESEAVGWTACVCEYAHAYMWGSAGAVLNVEGAKWAEVSCFQRGDTSMKLLWEWVGNTLQPGVDNRRGHQDWTCTRLALFVALTCVPYETCFVKVLLYAPGLRTCARIQSSCSSFV